MDLPRPGDPYIGPLAQPAEPVRHDKADGLTGVVKETRSVLPRFAGYFPPNKLPLSEIPTQDMQQQAAISAIVTMRLMGMEDVDIATVFNINLSDVQELIKDPASQITFERVFLGVVNANAENIQGRLASYADKAVTKVVSLMEAEREDVQLKAAQDILDRSGTNADHFFSVNNKPVSVEDELRIVVVDDDGETKKQVEVSIKRK